MIFFLIGLGILLFNLKKLFIKENFWLLVALTWIIFSFLGVMGASLSIGFVPFRMWTFFGISMSLVTGYAIYLVLSSLDKIFRSNRAIAKAVFIILFVILAYYTSFVPKYVHNTVTWPEHQVIVPESQQLYVWMREGGLPKDSMVTNICHREFVPLGYDMLSKPWLSEELDELGENAYYRTALNNSLDDNYDFLKRNGFDYVILGASCIAKFKVDQNLLLARLNEMANSTMFSIVKSTNAEFLFKVN
jgi:hypothetical protein